MICKLKPYEWKALADLLHKGVSFQDAYDVIGDHDDITSHLEAGTSIDTVLLQGQKGKFYDHLRFFLRITSLADAIDAAHQMHAFEISIRKKIVKQTSYPLLLLVMAFLTLYFFSVFIIPQLMQSFDMEEENKMLLIITDSLKYISQLVLMLLLCLALFGMLCMKKPTWKMLAGKYLLKITRLPAQLCSYTLAGYFIQLQTQGLATYSSFQFLDQLQKNTWFSTCVTNIKNGLEQGEDIVDVFKKEPMIVLTFCKSWRIGVHTQQLSLALQDYRRRQEESWFQGIKKIGIVIQCSAYTFVAIMVLLVYQIMLVPLQILETM